MQEPLLPASNNRKTDIRIQEIQDQIISRHGARGPVADITPNYPLKLTLSSPGTLHIVPQGHGGGFGKSKLFSCLGHVF